MRKLQLIRPLILAVAALILLSAAGCALRSAPGQYDNLAKHLTASGIKMYGAYWCSACQYQKDLLGKSWQYIDYVECGISDQPQQAETCEAAGVKKYPTWEFANGERVEGVLSPQELAEKSGFLDQQVTTQ